MTCPGRFSKHARKSQNLNQTSEHQTTIATFLSFHYHSTVNVLTVISYIRALSRWLTVVKFMRKRKKFTRQFHTSIKSFNFFHSSKIFYSSFTYTCWMSLLGSCNKVLFIYKSISTFWIPLCTFKIIIFLIHNIPMSISNQLILVWNFRRRIRVLIRFVFTTEC